MTLPLRLLAILAALVLGITAAQAQQRQRITLVVPGPGAISYLPAELISRIGADRAEGVEVQVNYATGGATALAELLDNNADFAITGMPAAMSTQLKDPRLVALAPVNDLPLYVLLVRKGLQGEVRKVGDLRGRAIGFHSDSTATKTTSQQVLELMFRRGGLKPESYRKVVVGRRWESESLMLKNGEADAVMSDEPHASRMVAENIAFPLIHLGDPETARNFAGAGFLRGTLISRRDLVDKDPARAAAMVRILQRTLQWIAARPPEEVVAKLDIASADERAQLVALLRKYPRQYSTDGKFSTRQLRETEIFFIDSQAGNQAAEAFRIESMVVDKWAGRKN